jgi:hypothetical protein
LILDPKSTESNPLDRDLPIFTQSDEGLNYGTKDEKLEAGVTGSRIFS